MRCSCQCCGAYMTQDERGLDSRCVCPACLAVCNACMGTPEGPKEREALLALLAERQRMYEPDANAAPTPPLSTLHTEL